MALLVPDSHDAPPMSLPSRVRRPRPRCKPGDGQGNGADENREPFTQAVLAESQFSHPDVAKIFANLWAWRMLKCHLYLLFAASPGAESRCEGSQSPCSPDYRLWSLTKDWACFPGTDV